MRQNTDHPAKEEATARCTLRAFLSCYLRLGTLGFDGPTTLTSSLQRDLAEERGWISPPDYCGAL